LAPGTTLEVDAHFHLYRGSRGRHPHGRAALASPEPGVRLFAKLEGQNPTGSIKDRIVERILRVARESGALEPGQRIVEASTGNTGVSVAMFGELMGHPVDVCVPESVYPEIEELLRAYGARIRFVPRQAGIKSAVEVAREVAAEQGAFLLDRSSARRTSAPITTGQPRKSSATCPTWTSLLPGWARAGRSREPAAA
jgi:cysteine synthase